MDHFRKESRTSLTGLCIASVMIALLAAGASLHADEPKLPPEGDALAAALATVREAFREELVKQKPDELQAVAKKIVSLADAEQDSSTRYAMLIEARSAAMRAEDVDLTFEILREQAAVYRIDLAAQRTELFLALAKSAKAPETHRKLIEQNLALIDELVNSGELDAAEKQLRTADVSMPKAKEATLSRRVIEARSRINTFKRETQLFGIAQSKLLEMPEDADANLAAGRYLCFFKGDWDRGLAHLVKGRDAALAAAAKSDAAKPSESAAQATTAGLWWDLSEKQTGRLRDAMQLRAVYWYEMALPSLTGLAKSIAEKRIETAAKIADSGAASAGSTKPINLIADADGQRDSLTGRWSVEKGEITCPSENWARFRFIQKIDADEFDVTIEFTRHQGNQGFGIYVRPGGKPVHFGLSALDNQFISVGEFKGEQPKNMQHVRVPIGPNGKRQQAKFQVRKNSLTTWLNGKMVLQYTTDFSNVGPQDWGFKDTSIGLLSWYNSITFHRVELQVVKGK